MNHESEIAPSLARENSNPTAKAKLFENVKNEEISVIHQVGHKNGAWIRDAGLMADIRDPLLEAEEAEGSSRRSSVCCSAS